MLTGKVASKFSFALQGNGYKTYSKNKLYCSSSDLKSYAMKTFLGANEPQKNLKELKTFYPMFFCTNLESKHVCYKNIIFIIHHIVWGGGDDPQNNVK